MTFVKSVTIILVIPDMLEAVIGYIKLPGGETTGSIFKMIKEWQKLSGEAGAQSH